MNTKISLLAAALAALAGTAQAAVVVDTLPYTGTPDWTDITFAGTSMVVSGSPPRSVLTTAQSRGVWFGWGAWYGDQPAWTPGTSSAGNYLGLQASFSAGAADWSAYFYDRTHEAAFSFAPTGCGDPLNCYGLDGAAGVSLLHAVPGSTDAGSTFVALDLTLPHSYEFLLKDGLVSYRIDGVVAYSGAAYHAPLGNALLVIGDGSGSTLTGKGAMRIDAIAFDNAPEAAALTTVPLPAALPMFAAAAAWLGGRVRRTRV
ncbi:MAG: hypothetical protein AB7Q97_13905 [Gammaproteobacteria bacterium]